MVTWGKNQPNHCHQNFSTHFYILLVFKALSYTLRIIGNGNNQLRQSNFKNFWQIWMKDWRSRAASMGGLFFRLFFQSWVWQKKVKQAKSIRKKFYDFFYIFFSSDSNFFPCKLVQTCANLLIFEPNINTIVWICFSTQFLIASSGCDP